MNDREPIIVLRNILLLLILGTVPDKEKAADLALHIWYSSFIPREYDLQAEVILTKLFMTLDLDTNMEAPFSAPLGESSTLLGQFNAPMMRELYATSKAQCSITDAAEGLSRVR